MMNKLRKSNSNITVHHASVKTLKNCGVEVEELFDWGTDNYSYKITVHIL